jgi:hypothetical protein
MILAAARRAAPAVTPAPREQAGAAGRIIVGRNSSYQGYNDTQSWALRKIWHLMRALSLGQRH